MALVGYFVTHEMGLAKIYPYTKFEVSSFARSRFMEEGCAQTNAWISVVFIGPPPNLASI